MVLPKDIDAYLNRRFYSPRSPGSFTSAAKLHSVIKKEGRYNITLARIKDWARGQDILTLHKTAKQRQQLYRRVIAPGMSHLWDTDLLVLTGKRFITVNEGNAYILITVDVFSRYCYAEAIKTKGGKDVTEAFRSILDRSMNIPRFIRSDRGTEFSNSLVQALFKEKGIKHYYGSTETKANYAEILIKNIKKRLFQFFQNNNSYSYIDSLQDIVHSYNNTLHSSIGIAPVSVTRGNERDVWDYQYVINSRHYRKTLERALRLTRRKKRKKSYPYKYSIGETVRAAYFARKPFHRAYDEQFTGEVFTVRARKIIDGVSVYYLTDYGGENVDGHFYASELTSTRYDPKALFKIEKVLKNRVREGVRESLVKYQSWPDKYNEWITTSSIKDLDNKKKSKK